MNQPKPKIRLFVPGDYAVGAMVALGEKPSHYLANVMRCKAGDALAIFNGTDGEWRAEISALSKKQVMVDLKKQIAPQSSVPDIWLAFAPIKNKTELVVEKAVELGVSKLLPVFTHHAVVRSINAEKLTAHAVEAAEQCGRCDVPAMEDYKDLSVLLGAWPQGRTLLYGDESGGGVPLKTLLSDLLLFSPCLRGEPEGGGDQSLPHRSVKDFASQNPSFTASPAGGGGKYGLLIGPEGGFSEDEHRMLRAASFVKPFGMGPRILRADTAAVAALACVQSWLGDWDMNPSSCGPQCGSTGFDEILRNRSRDSQDDV